MLACSKCGPQPLLAFVVLASPGGGAVWERVFSPSLAYLRKAALSRDLLTWKLPRVQQTELRGSKSLGGKMLQLYSHSLSLAVGISLLALPGTLSPIRIRVFMTHYRVCMDLKNTVSLLAALKPWELLELVIYALIKKHVG